ncbi:ankyrin repeat domain-containing protein 16-like isoform X2 [Vespula squamosa]|uniref:Ankyrin repeat domain-containing protein 16-like isoform X2 n=1 Tax=Vespula squamosa TaxID=30214 RepID=A0ABD2BRC3_VESSQ
MVTIGSERVILKRSEKTEEIFMIISLDRYGDRAMQQRLCLNGDEELYSIKDSFVRTLNLYTCNFLANCFFSRMYTRLRKPCPEILDWHKINRIVS